jgi:hypothetical protein
VVFDTRDGSSTEAEIVSAFLSAWCQARFDDLSQWVSGSCDWLGKRLEPGTFASEKFRAIHSQASWRWTHLRELERGLWRPLLMTVEPDEVRIFLADLHRGPKPVTAAFFVRGLKIVSVHDGHELILECQRRLSPAGPIAESA